MSRAIALALVMLYPAWAAGAADHVIPLDEASWHAMPGWTPATAAEHHSHSFADGTARFTAKGAGRTMVWARHFTPPLDIKGLRHLTIRYRCQHLNPDLRSYFLFLSSGTDGRMTSERLALAASHLIIDGRWHVMTTGLKIRDALSAAALRFQAVHGHEASVEISHLGITARPPRFPIGHSLAWEAGEDARLGTPITLSPKRTTKLAELQTAIGLSDWFTADSVLATGIPFRLSRREEVAIGTPVKQKQTVVIPVGVRAESLWLLMGAQFSPRILTYDAWQPGDSIDQPERFSARVVYEDGTEDRQLPYCVDMKEHAIWRGLHVYEIAIDHEQPVKEVHLRDGMLTSAFHIIALTAGSKRFAPAQLGTHHLPDVGSVRSRAVPTAQTSDTTLLLRNAAGSIALDHSSGLSFTSVRGDFGADWRISLRPEQLFTVRDGKQLWTSADFRWESTPVSTGARVEYRGTSEPANLAARVTAQATEHGEFGLSLAFRNLASQTRFLAVTFPRLQVALDANPGDLWYFLPRSCGVLSNADHAFRTAYGGKFPVQWMDLFDAQHGGGVYVSTRTQSVWHRWYEGGKRGDVGFAEVEYLDNVPLPAGKWVEYPQAVVGLHPGDWHAAFDAYQRWRATWSKPLRPRLDWFRRTWHLRTHWVRTLGHRGLKGPRESNWRDPDTGELRSAAFVDKDRQMFGYIDYIHLFDWRISNDHGRWGDYCHYDDIGGLPAFRSAIRAAQAKGIRMGLYLDTFLVSRKSLIGKSQAQKWAVAGQNGKLGDGYSSKDDPLYNMCASHPEWQDYLAKTCARVANETGCDGIYLDEGGMDLPQYWCWRKEHSHPVPATTIAGQRSLFEKVKSALPSRVALYTEYTPPDALIPYLDGAYMACLRTTSLRWSPGYLNISRFSFPDFKIFVIANGGSMFDGIYDGLKYSLFNGIALYSLAWGHDSEAFELCAKISRILKDHEDAFLTLEPRPLVPTDRTDVYANEFPGERETVWTLWNGRFRTVRGGIMRVPHVQGARYRDIWNGQDLKPRVSAGTALIEVEIGPRDIGVFARTQP